MVGVVIGLVMMVLAVGLLFAARAPTRRYLEAFEAAYHRLPMGREWLSKRDRDPVIERLRRGAVSTRVGAFLLFVFGALLSVTRAH